MPSCNRMGFPMNQYGSRNHVCLGQLPEQHGFRGVRRTQEGGASGQDGMAQGIEGLHGKELLCVFRAIVAGVFANGLQRTRQPLAIGLAACPATCSSSINDIQCCLVTFSTFRAQTIPPATLLVRFLAEQRSEREGPNASPNWHAMRQAWHGMLLDSTGAIRRASRPLQPNGV